VHPYHAWPFESVPNHALLSALWEAFAHGTLCLIAVLPLVLRSRRPLVAAAAAVVGGVAIDLDHAVAAGSLSLHAMETMRGRPDTHSFVVALAAGVLVAVVTRRALFGWAVFAVYAAHLLLDAPGGGTPLLWPVADVRELPWLACPAGIVALAVGSALAARAHAPRARAAIARDAGRGRVPA